MHKPTEKHYLEIAAKCKEIFLKKNKDYGASWSIMRLSSITDQIFIKAKRIRNIQESKQNKIGDSETDEFRGIINYCIMAMILKNEEAMNETNTVEVLYDKYTMETFQLMKDKNTDYGEVWRDMRVSSMTDLMLTKLLRIKQIEDNEGFTVISEGVFSNYQDIMNYAVFCLIKLENT